MPRRPGYWAEVYRRRNLKAQREGFRSYGQKRYQQEQRTPVLQRGEVFPANVYRIAPRRRMIDHYTYTFNVRIKLDTGRLRWITVVVGSDERLSKPELASQVAQQIEEQWASGHGSPPGEVPEIRRIDLRSAYRAA